MLWWRRGRVELLIPYFLPCHHSGKKRGIFGLRFDIDEIFPIDGNALKHLPDQGLPLCAVFFIGNVSPFVLLAEVFQGSLQPFPKLPTGLVINRLEGEL